MRVLITGGNGTVGTAITDHLGDEDRFEFTVMEIENGDGDVATVEADVRDYESIRAHFDDHDAVIHLALIPGSNMPGDRSIAWNRSHAENLEGIHNVYAAAIEAGLETVVFASSNHAVGMVEVQHRPDVYYDEGIVAGHDEPHRPDSLYGLAKCYGEDLGRLMAEAHGIPFYALRIGSVRDPEYDHPFGDAERGVDAGRWERDSEEYEEQVARLRGLWQSRRDLSHLVECCLVDDTVEWDHFYGVSGNDRRWLDDLEYARETIGYEPMDNGETYDRPPA